MLNISFMELASLDTLHHSQTVFVDVRILEATQFLLSDTGWASWNHGGSASVESPCCYELLDMGMSCLRRSDKTSLRYRPPPQPILSTSVSYSLSAASSPSASPASPTAVQWSTTACPQFSQSSTRPPPTSKSHTEHTIPPFLYLIDNYKHKW
ncbi:hypothetical protein Vi05172_g7643 [Venturia inaequalis]|nr:hypothetical protein Vi05172_g7643 [Venturia inaequalis]